MIVYVVLGPRGSFDSVYADKGDAELWAAFQNHKRPRGRYFVLPREVIA